MSPDLVERSSVSETGPLILFDGICNLCNWSVRFLAPRDREGVLWYASVQSRAGQAILQREGLPLDSYESFLFLENGRLYSKSQAFFRVAGYMRFPWPLVRAGLILPRRLADWLYDRVAKNRYAVFGKRDVCMVPDKDLAARFLEDR